MDDFLHNLRSGKLKHPDRGRRDYSDYKGPQRRSSGTDRRKHEHYKKVKTDHLLLIKDILETISQNNRRIADALETRSAAEERKAAALESIAEGLRFSLNFKPSDKTIETTPAESEPESPEPAAKTAEPVESDSTPKSTIDKTAKKLRDKDRMNVFKIISKRKDEKDSWEQIARYLVSESIPTLSGKGKWRGPVVKSFFNKIAVQ